MGTVVRFPKVRRRARGRAVGKTGETAIVVILPVIRIERDQLRAPRRRRPRASRN